jgi:orotate phosphoribosyltransferase
MKPIGRELAPALANAGILKQSPRAVDGAEVVVDTRGLGTRPHLEALIAATIATNAVDAGATLLGGVANSGTAWAASAARAAGLPHCNVLVDGPRTKGLGRHVEPDDIAGHRMVLIDNWLSTGGSLRTARRIVESLGATVCGAIVVSAATEVIDLDGLHVAVLWPRDLLQAAIHTRA